MKIAIDARLYNESGIGRYIRNLIDKLENLDLKNEYYILLLKDQYSRMNFNNKLFNRVLADFKWYGLNEQIKLPSILKSLKVDLVHFPHFNIPINYDGDFVVTIHDLILQHFRMDRATLHNPITYKIKQWGYEKVFSNGIAKSKRILVPSDYVKNLLISERNINPDKIVVTYEAVDDEILKIQGEPSSIFKKQISNPYIFYVGNAHPHKNVEGLIKAFVMLKKKYPDLSLVLSGYDHYFWKQIKKENNYPGVIYTGYVSDKELIFLYKNALCFVMPSFEEGFGIPLLEAMAFNCPVVSSYAGSLKEIGADAALFFNPHKIKDMAEKIEKVLSGGNVRKKLKDRGAKRFKMFSWQKLAKQTMEVYDQCV